MKSSAHTPYDYMLHTILHFMFEVFLAFMYVFSLERTHMFFNCLFVHVLILIFLGFELFLRNSFLNLKVCLFMTAVGYLSLVETHL